MYTPLEGPDAMLLERNGNGQCGSQNHHVCHKAWFQQSVGMIYLFEIIQKLHVIKKNQIISVSIA